MTIKKFHVYTADLNPRFGTEPGKLRPVVVIQTDLLNQIHPSTIVCPVSTNVHPESDLLRVHLRKGEAGLEKPSDILVDQVRAIDNKRFVKHLGIISDRNKLKLLDNLKILVLE
ncbi:type II toxin-antitoxin system PemK/MazF family toxin [bacterium]|nr:type II toxin-antitoxin system PemK/MazF family toxin [bacterium]